MNLFEELEEEAKQEKEGKRELKKSVTVITTFLTSLFLEPFVLMLTWNYLISTIGYRGWVVGYWQAFCFAFLFKKLKTFYIINKKET